MRGTFENSDEASESESPRMVHPAVSEGPRRIQASLARRLTQELIDREMLRAPSPEGKSRKDSTPSSESGPLEPDPPTRYPGAMGLPFGGEESESDQPADERAWLRLELQDAHKESFSAPTSPTGAPRFRHGSKVGSVLGLSSAGLRRETAREKQSLSDRLSVEFESYANHVAQTVKIARRASARGDGAAAAAAAAAAVAGDAASSMLLTSADIPLEMILSDPIHRKTFRMLAESLFCAESLLFWERVNDFRALCAREPAVAAALANNIYKNFLDAKAEKQLLVREALLEPLRAALMLGEVRPDVFDAIQLEAYSTMQFSLYPEYLAYLNASRQSLSPATASKEPRSLAANAAARQSSHQSASPSLRCGLDAIFSFCLTFSRRSDCLTKPEFAAPFRTFAEELLCAENIDFWSRVNAFQSVLDPEELQQQAGAIWDDFLSPFSPSELNVGSKIRRSIRYEVENKLVTASTFNEAQRDILKLISLDVYPKFCQEWAAEK